MKHQDFRHIAVESAFDAIENSVLPSLTRLIDTSAAAQPGLNAEASAAQLRALARQLDSLTQMVEASLPRQAEPFTTEA